MIWTLTTLAGTAIFYAGYLLGYITDRRRPVRAVMTFIWDMHVTSKDIAKTKELAHDRYPNHRLP